MAEQRAVTLVASKVSLMAVPKAVRWDGHWAVGSVDDLAEWTAALSVVQSVDGSAAYWAARLAAWWDYYSAEMSAALTVGKLDACSGDLSEHR